MRDWSQWNTVVVAALAQVEPSRGIACDKMYRCTCCGRDFLAGHSEVGPPLALMERFPSVPRVRCRGCQALECLARTLRSIAEDDEAMSRLLGDLHRAALTALDSSDGEHQDGA